MRNKQFQSITSIKIWICWFALNLQNLQQLIDGINAILYISFEHGKLVIYALVLLSVTINTWHSLALLLHLLQNHWANFNQTWQKASLGEGDSSLFKWRTCPFPRGDNYTNSENTLMKFKNILLQNHWANFNQTWHKASLGKGNLCLLKWRAPPFSKGR